MNYEAGTVFIANCEEAPYYIFRCSENVKPHSFAIPGQWFESLFTTDSGIMYKVWAAEKESSLWMDCCVGILDSVGIATPNDMDERIFISTETNEKIIELLEKCLNDEMSDTPEEPSIFSYGPQNPTHETLDKCVSASIDYYFQVIYHHEMSRTKSFFNITFSIILVFNFLMYHHDDIFCDS